MSRRPPLQAEESTPLGMSRMAPGGRLWSESPVRRPYPRVRHVGVVAEVPPPTEVYAEVGYFVDTSTGGMVGAEGYFPVVLDEGGLTRVGPAKLTGRVAQFYAGAHLMEDIPGPDDWPRGDFVTVGGISYEISEANGWVEYNIRPYGSEGYLYYVQYAFTLSEVDHPGIATGTFDLPIFSGPGSDGTYSGWRVQGGVDSTIGYLSIVTMVAMA